MPLAFTPVGAIIEGLLVDITDCLLLNYVCYFIDFDQVRRYQEDITDNIYCAGMIAFEGLRPIMDERIDYLQAEL